MRNFHKRWEFFFIKKYFSFPFPLNHDIISFNLTCYTKISIKNTRTAATQFFFFAGFYLKYFYICSTSKAFFQESHITWFPAFIKFIKLIINSLLKRFLILSWKQCYLPVPVSSLTYFLLYLLDLSFSSRV